MSLQKTGYTSETPLHYVLDAGAVYKNLIYTDGEWTGTLLGATSGGNEFAVEQEYRNIEIDGVYGNVKGNKVLQSEVAKLVVNVKEVTAENVRMALNATLTSDTNYDIIESKGKLDDSDYLENIAYVGTIAGSDKPIVCIIENALCTGGLNLKSEDNNEAVIPMTFEDSKEATNANTRKAAYKIYLPKIA